jgi:hypothetical protein
MIKRGALLIIALFLVSIPISFAFTDSSGDLNLTLDIGSGSDSGESGGYNYSSSTSNEAVGDLTGGDYNMTLGVSSEDDEAAAAPPSTPPSTPAATSSNAGTSACADECQVIGSRVCIDGNAGVCGYFDSDSCADLNIQVCLPEERCENGECLTNGCIEDWVCEDWSECRSEVQSRQCADWNECGTSEYMPLTYKSCTAEEDTDKEKLPAVETPAPVPFKITKPMIITILSITLAIAIFLMFQYKPYIIRTAKITKNAIKNTAKAIKTAGKTKIKKVKLESVYRSKIKRITEATEKARKQSEKQAKKQISGLVKQFHSEIKKIKK